MKIIQLQDLETGHIKYYLIIWVLVNVFSFRIMSRPLGIVERLVINITATNASTKTTPQTIIIINLLNITYPIIINVEYVLKKLSLYLGVQEKLTEESYIAKLFSIQLLVISHSADTSQLFPVFCLRRE